MPVAFSYTTARCSVPKLPEAEEPKPPPLRLILEVEVEVEEEVEVPPTLHAVKQFVLRTPLGLLLGKAEDLVQANGAARKLRRKVVVYKVTPEGEVAMSHSGPGGWSGSGCKPVKQTWRGPY